MKKNGAFVIAIASGIEMRQAARRMVQTRQEPQAGAVLLTGALAGRECVLVKTGVGAKKAASAARLIAQRYAPSCVLMTGAAGAADPVLDVGDIVVADSIVLQSGGVFPCNPPGTGRAREILKKAGLPVSSGACLTVDRFVHRKQEKKELFDRFGAAVIDMESGAIARRLHEEGIPFLNVRVVSDTAREDTADLNGLYYKKKKGGAAGAGRHFMQRPSEVLKTARLMKDVQRASRRIADVVELLASGRCFENVVCPS